MAANNSTIILKGCIDSFKTENNLTLKESEVFELFSLSQILKNEDVSFDNLMDSMTDGGQDGGIDSIVIMHNGNYIEDDTDCKCKSSCVTKLIITQCKTEKTFKESVLDKLVSTCPVLFDLDAKKEDLEKRFNPQIIEKFDVLKKVWTDTIVGGGKIEVYINYACMANDIEISPSFKSKREQLRVMCKELFSTDKVEFNCFSSRELLTLFQTHKKNKSTVLFNDAPLAVNYGEMGLGYIGLVKLSDYRSLLLLDDGSINEELFESNVRHFQGEKVDVNKKIRNTLENISDRDFWWLNNGITIIAENPKQLSKKLILENVQIVNGLQTSYSIYNLGTVRKDDERSVLVKVIISENKDVADDIIEATNYQNTVSPVLLRATESTQKDIELYFLQKGYYYDRRKNYYKNQGKPGNKIFGILFLAQAIKTIILRDPHSARATPTSLLKTDSSYKDIFKSHDSYEAYLKCCLIVSKVHHNILNLEDKLQKNRLVNFKFHVSMVAACTYLNKTNYTIEDVANIDMHKIEDSVASAIRQIEELIGSYQKLNPQSNLINIAKSSDFTTYIKNNMQ